MIVIGVPVPKNHQIDVRTAAYCMAECRADVRWGYVASRECGVGRSTIVRTTLEDPDVTHVYNVDSDVAPPLGTLQRLLAYDVPIVAGIYPTSTKGRTWSFKLDNDLDWFPRNMVVPSELFEATAIGGSTVLIKRDVFGVLETPWFRASYGADGDYVEKEDEYFSRTARDAGFKLMVDPTIVCKHYNYGEI